MTPRLAAVLLAVVLAAAPAAAQDIVLDPRVFAIGRELRCPTCVAESVSESNAAIAQEMRQLIQEQLADGRDRQEILGFFQDRYGDWILLSPPRRGVLLVVWLLPIAAAIAGAFALVFWMRRWRAAAEAVAPASEEDLARVRAALARTDAAPDPTPPSPRP